MTERLRGRRGQRQRARRFQLYPTCRRCAESGIVTPTEIINHIVPLALGGEDTNENCEGLCKPCDLVVTAEQFGHAKPVTFGLDGWPIEEKQP